MIRGRYPLAVVRRQRERGKQEALNEYAERLTAVTRAKAELAALRSALDRNLVDLDEAQTSLVSAAKPREVGRLRALSDGVIAIHKRVTDGHDAIAGKLEELAGAQVDCSDARSQLAGAMRRLGALDRHFERWQARRQAEARRRESEALDEISTAAWVAARAGRPS